MITLGRPKAELVLSEEERGRLSALTTRRKSAQALAQRARIVLRCAEGVSNTAVAAEEGVTLPNVGKWRARFVRHRLAGLDDAARSGPPRTISDAEVERVITTTLESKPENATHKTPTILRWLQRHRRFHLHFIPTHSSWLNQIERWFAKITNQAIRRGSFHSVPHLRQTILDYIAANNRDPKLFVWTASADLILGKVAHLCGELV